MKILNDDIHPNKNEHFTLIIRVPDFYFIIELQNVLIMPRCDTLEAT